MEIENHKDTVFNQLLEMGFIQSDIERGWNNSSIQTSEGIINYLDANPHKEESQKTDENIKKNKGVEKIVKAELVEKVMSTGYSLLISQKAVLLSGNKTFEDALNWISEHKEDKDFEEPIEIEEPPKLTKEEARLKALELGKEIRKKALEIEEKNKLESEKLRKKMAKEISDSRRVVKEQEQRLAVEAYLREKKKLEEEKNMMLKKLEQDKIERFGEKAIKSKKVVEKSPKTKFLDIYNKMYNIYRMGEMSLLMTCIKTMKIYLANILKSPQEEKFRKINASNANFCKRIKDITGATMLLELYGFKLVDGFYFMEEVDNDNLNIYLDILEEKIMGLQNFL